MDKRAKKRIVVLRERLQKLQLQLSGMRRQCDDPVETEQLLQQIAETRNALDAAADVSGDECKQLGGIRT